MTDSGRGIEKACSSVKRSFAVGDFQAIAAFAVSEGSNRSHRLSMNAHDLSRSRGFST